MERGTVDEVDVQASIERRRVVLKSMFDAVIEDYGLPTGVLVGLCVSVLARSRPIFNVGFGFALFFGVLAVFWIYAAHRSYRLVRFDVFGSQDALLERVIAAVEELGWTVMEEQNDLVISYTASQVVTVIVQPNAIYVGSRNRVDTRNGRRARGRVPFSFGRDAEAIKTLRGALGLEGSASQALEP